MKVKRDTKNCILYLNHFSYVTEVLEEFSMSNAKPISMPLANHFKL